MVRFNPPPNWPTPPADFVPLPGWHPDPSWPPPPPGWVLFVEETTSPATDPVAVLQADVAVLEERRAHVLAALADAEELLAARRRQLEEAEARLVNLQKRASGGSPTTNGDRTEDV